MELVLEINMNSSILISIGSLLNSFIKISMLAAPNRIYKKKMAAQKLQE